MRGSLKQRYKGSWSLIVDLGYEVDPATGKQKRRQKWITVRGTKRDAERKLAELVHRADSGTFVEPNKVTVSEWLDTWLEKAIKPPRRTLRAYETYTSVINKHLKPKLGAIRLQELRAIDVLVHMLDIDLRFVRRFCFFFCFRGDHLVANNRF